jgi:hypothetical protein
METKNKLVELQDIINVYGVPDPKIIGKLPKGGIQLDFVGHADVTKMLIEIDAHWSWEPTAFDTDGLPAYRVENGYAHMAGWLTIHGVRRLGIGSVAHNKQDLLKELVSDFIRNAAMRFGICLSLWTKQEWDDVDRPVSAPAQPAKKSTGPPKKAVEPGMNDDDALTEEQIAAFNKACVDADLNPMSIYKLADVRFGFGKQKDLGALREAFKKAKTSKKEG